MFQSTKTREPRDNLRPIIERHKLAGTGIIRAATYENRYNMQSEMYSILLFSFL